MILLIDNYDSFVYNLYQMAGSVYEKLKGGSQEELIVVRRNDAVTIGEIEQMGPKALILSPGPGRPEQAGICQEAIVHFAGKIPILGVCLGHQAICQVYGAKITYAKELMHGKTSEIQADTGSLLFRGLENPVTVARYHSLAAESLPEELKATAMTNEGEVMAVEHRKYPIYGVQFHPESVMTPQGANMIENFLLAGEKRPLGWK